MKNTVKLALVDDTPPVGEIFKLQVDQYNKSDNGTLIIESVVFTDPELFLSSHDHFDIVLLDIYMPKMNGLEVFEELKRLRRLDSVILFNSCDMKELEGTRTYLDKSKTRISDIVERYYEFKDRTLGNMLNLQFSIQGLSIG